VSRGLVLHTVESDTASNEGETNDVEANDVGANDAKASESEASGADQAAPSEDTEPALAIVGIGASAGGLDPLRVLLANADPEVPAAYVIIQHLDPDHESLMVDVLSRGSALPVAQIEDGVRPRPGHVYVIPPNKYLTVENGLLRLSSPSERRGWRMAVDHFFRSLATDARERGVAIVLSGTGTDGTIGIKAIKEAGGMVMVQEPEEARHDGMPRSAISTGVVDYVVPVGEMTGILASYLRHPYVMQAEPITRDDEIDAVDGVLAVLLEVTHHDFRPYKKSTILRRIQRRMGLRYLERMDDYLAYVREHPEEVKSLHRDLLIGVTEFFRGPESFELLERRVIPKLIGAKHSDDYIRIWVPGCSTGEEAYSLAMLMMDAIAASGRTLKLQVFATDIDSEALDVGRAGVYPKAALSEVPPERVRAYFKREGEQLLVKKDLRETVVFAVQNLIGDPPFSRLDLISCRNLLIYLEPRVQSSLIRMFHFALGRGGFLMLGGSENIAQHTELFEPVSKKWRIYRRLETGRRERFQLPAVPDAGHRHGARRREVVNLAAVAERRLLRRYAPASVLVERNGEILHVSGDTSPYLMLPQGPPNVDVLGMVRDSIRGRLRAALHRAVHQNQEVTVSCRLDSGAELHITVEPLPGADNTKVYLIVFREAPPRAELDEADASSDNQGFVRELEAELQATKSDLQSTIEELEISNQELRASNEEIMSMNEELQSTNEELETSQEELQSLNEELITLNNQLQDKVGELEETNNDIANLLTSTDIATLFVSPELDIKRYTPSILGLLEMLPTDIGRPLTNIAPQFEDPALFADIRAVLDDCKPRSAEIYGTTTERWYTRRVVPYRTEDREVDGAVVTFTDITELKLTAEKLEQARRELEMRVEERTAELRAEKHRLQSVLETASDAILTIDEHGVIDLVNPAAEQMFGYEPGELAGESIATLMPQPYADEHTSYIRRYLDTGEARVIGRGREVAGRRKDGSVFPIELSVGEDGEGAHGRMFTGIIRDLSRRKQLEQDFLQAQKLETIGRLTGGIAHDFNNVLMGIMSSTDVLLLKINPDSDARPFAEALKREAVRGSTLTRQLLSFSRKRDTKVEVLELDSVVAAVQPMLDPILGKDVVLRVRLESNGGRVLADRGHIEQILVNLVGNARDAIQSTGKIKISVTRVRLDVERARARGVLPGPYLQLSVQDTGCGMDEETRRKAMEPFFTTKAEGEGTGLGLSTVFGMVEQARGRISIASNPGEGTTISILLPEFDDSKREPSPRGSATVLLVEDESQVRLGIRRHLERGGYTVHCADDAETALKLVDEGVEIDLLLTDIVLPGMSGGELAERLDERGIPAIFMSAFPASKLRREGRIPEGVPSLHKPFEEDELLWTIRTTLDAQDANDTVKLPPGRVLIIEDNVTTRAAYVDILTELGLEVLEAGTGAEARKLAHQHRLDLLICDLGLPDEPGTRVIADLRVLFPEIAVLFITGKPQDEPTLVAPLSTPRTKVMIKPVALDDLVRAISGLLRR
jgi:two-component system CheB/CheR fusion protein